MLLLLVVGFHELGHYIGARLFGVFIKQFSIGFGPRLFSYTTSKKTTWCFRLIPLGGYVSLLDSRQDKLSDRQNSQAFDHKTPLIRSIIIALGPFFSIMLAIIIYSLLFMRGFSLEKPNISAVTPNSIAFHAGLRAQDEIRQVGEYTTRDWTFVMLALIANAGKDNVAIKVRCLNGLEKQYQVNLSKWRLTGYKPQLLKSLGISRDKKQKPQAIILPPLKALSAGAERTVQHIMLNLVFLQKVLQGYVSYRALGGALSIFSSAAFLFSISFELFLRFTALFSIAVGVANLFPIPGLDGGQLIFIAIEKIRGKQLTIAVEALLYRLSFALLFFIMMQLLANDFYRMASPSSF